MKNILTLLLFTVNIYFYSNSQPLTVSFYPLIGGPTITLQCSQSTSLSATPSGGVPPYTYQWSTGATTQSIFINNQIGSYSYISYTVTVTDAASNTASISQTIETLPYFIGFLNFYAPSPGQCDGGFIFAPSPLQIYGPFPNLPIPLNNGACGAILCQNDPPVTLQISYGPGCPWQYAPTFDPSIHYSGPYIITPTATSIQSSNNFNVSVKIKNNHKLNWSSMPIGLVYPGNGGLDFVGTSVQIRDMQNIVIASTGFGPNTSNLIQYKDSVIYNFSNIPPGTYVFHYTEGLYPHWQWSTDTFGIHLIDTFIVDGSIAGKIYIDLNSNCLDESGESELSYLKIQLYQNGNLIQQVYSNSEGIYTFNTDTGTFTYTVDTTDLPILISCPVSGFHTSVLTPADSMDYNMDFAMQCKSGFDVGVKNIVRQSGQFFPANYATIKVGAGDMSNFFGLPCATGVSGTVTININGPVAYISEAPGALVPAISGNTILTYNISDFGTINFNSDFRFIIQTDTTAQAGNQICFFVNVTPITGDNDTTNNTLQHCFTVVNSFDPNDKQVFPSGDLLPDHEWLTYTIRFQNTGTAPAQHIYILDTLDANLDVSTFTLLSYSHDNLTQVLGDVVRFNFPNINLPDSTNDEPNSHGYVQYKIKLKPGLPIGTVISNTAYNFFDFNPPIATNTVQNQIYFLSPTITPNNLILCPNESDTLWTQVYDSYQWFKDGNLITGANNQYLVVDYFNDSGSQFMVEVDSAGVIAQSPPVLVDGWAFLPPFVIQEGDFTIGSLGEMILCPGDTAYLILGQPYDTNIQWTDNGVAIPNANNDTLIVTQAGLYNVSGSPTQCPNYVQSLFDDVQVVISAPLSPTITPNSLILCPNESDTLWTQQFGTYQWYKDGNLIPGATNQYLVVEQFNDAGSQFYVVVSQGNCTGTSSQVLVDSWIFLLPYVISEGTFTVGPNGEMLICPGDTAYLILGQPYDTNIQWTESGNIIPGANDDTLVVTQSGNYNVSGAPSNCPNFIQNLGVTIEVIVQGPPVPVITINMAGTHLETSPGFVLYEWFHEGNAIGINSNVIPIQGGGMYTVIVTDANGCTAESQPIVISSLIENPISGNINVNYNSQNSTLQITRTITTSDTEIFVLDVLGRVIADEKIAKGISEIQIKLSNIKPGIYFVNLREGGSAKFFVE